MAKQCIVIAGPTAVGKTARAIELALTYSTEIISADSRQCYREMKIGVARPTEEELSSVPHHFIASHSIHDHINAADFRQYALQKIKKLFEKHDKVIMVGGTGLYIKAFTDGLDQIPAVPEAIRTHIIASYEEKGIGWLQEELKQKDFNFVVKGEMKNPQRMMRALEVMLHTGKSILHYQQQKKQQHDFDIIQYGIEIPRPQLNERIDQRVDEMLEAGLLEEVESLYPHKHLNALHTVGYVELMDHLDGKTSLDKAVELIKIHTHQYAKRQMTWFKRLEGMIWSSPRF
jgi:tRNA dimethylallyltransferase